MDTVSHALWGYGLFGSRGRPWTALFMGAAPDLASFGLFALVRLAHGEPIMGKPPLSIIPQWCFLAYDTMHSLVVASIAIALVWRKRPGIGFAMLAWPFHILLDIPFHARSYFPTKFLFPLSPVTIDGIPWYTPSVWMANLGALAILLAYRAYRKRGPAPAPSLERTEKKKGP